MTVVNIFLASSLQDLKEDQEVLGHYFKIYTHIDPLNLSILITMPKICPVEWHRGGDCRCCQPAGCSLPQYLHHFPEAEAAYLRAKEIYKKLAIAHPDVYRLSPAGTLRTLAIVYGYTSVLSQAKTLFRGRSPLRGSRCLHTSVQKAGRDGACTRR